MRGRRWKKGSREKMNLKERLRIERGWILKKWGNSERKRKEKKKIKDEEERLTI